MVVNIATLGQNYNQEKLPSYLSQDDTLLGEQEDTWQVGWSLFSTVALSFLYLSSVQASLHEVHSSQPVVEVANLTEGKGKRKRKRRHSNL